MSMIFTTDMYGIPKEKRIDIENIISYTVLKFFEYFKLLKNDLELDKKYYYNDNDYSILIKKYKSLHPKQELFKSDLSKEFYILHLKDSSASWNGFIRCNFDFSKDSIEFSIASANDDKKVFKKMKNFIESYNINENALRTLAYENKIIFVDCLIDKNIEYISYFKNCFYKSNHSFLGHLSDAIEYGYNV